ncbi:uncharacterized protein AKAME5_000015200 [Lates japonicus]|uniref:Uncharacterized protein n=1 Tax=Lates japonicus TaxID=270547 RepID=A0AAD3QUY3_LATJO|nr:uncharacterized protein AKAME5_000015200 [Lates japonicus]
MSSLFSLLSEHGALTGYWPEAVRKEETDHKLSCGICSYKDKYYKPGDSFRRGCDKCFCHDSGFYCFAPMKPTSWPKKCRRVRTECGYMVVYKENPLVECRAYSWIG